MKSPIHLSVTVTLLVAATALHGGIKVLVEHNPNDNATAGYRFKTVQELGESWKAFHENRLADTTTPSPEKGGPKANPPP